MNRNTRVYITKQLSFDFYVKFSEELRRIFPKLRWQDIYYIESTGGWATALYRTINENPQYQWFWHIWDKAEWYDSDLLDDILGTRLYNLCKKGKIKW